MKRDLRKKDIAYDALYEYAEPGIERLLSDIYRIYEDERYKGDLSATIIRMDLERALGSRALTPRQRQVVALYYFACLNLEETAFLLGVSFQKVHARLGDAVKSIARHMRGEDVKSAQLIVVDTQTWNDKINAWLEGVAMNDAQWWCVPADVWRQVALIFDEDRVSGEYDPAPTDDDYPWLTDGQLNWRRYREISRPEIYPRSANFGSCKKTDDGRREYLTKPAAS